MPRIPLDKNKWKLKRSRLIFFQKGNVMKKLIALSMFASLTTHAALSEHKAGEILIKLKPGMKNSFLSKRSLFGLNLKKELNLLQGQVLVFKTAKNLESTIKELSLLPEVQFAEPNFIYRAIGKREIQLPYFLNTSMLPSHAPTDPDFGKLWGLVN